ncbi:hypothetical protein PCANC_11840 [Puccinia coronata f. sp. avenae]|uniref:Fungal-type protein kinase domain-containing protein n=1 Tax=Puccinia coronata f. sp. avenae TaxID=200324 RepID=A0A2N5T0E5_9BASI|nr:hypothetical protein PCASD_16946 [Puccinia coronata f. sp. avenae]PLW18954.1 hypothetical protein PCANC_11840 [Puccinia coronata f. sp. avenae]
MVADAMNFMLNLLLIVTGLAVICRAGMEWNPLEDHWDQFWNEEGRRLLEHIDQPTSPTRYHPYASSHTSTTNLLTPSLSTSGLPDHFMTEDHAMRPPTNSPNIYTSPTGPTYSWPVSSDTHPFTSNTPVNSFAHTPGDTDDELFKRLPDNLGDYFTAHSDAASEELKIADKIPGQVTSSNNPIEHIAQKNLPLVDAIGMNTEEGDFYRLIFTSDLLRFPESDDGQFQSKIDMIKSIIKTREAESPSNPPGLLVKYGEMNTFMQPFKKSFSHKSSGKKRPKSSDLVVTPLGVFSRSSHLWMEVYHKRLGIDFRASEDWIKKAFINEGIRTSPSSDVEYKMNQHFVLYIVLVDMIITILPQPTENTINRIQVFREAVSCFQSYTEKTINNEQLNLKRMHSTL